MKKALIIILFLSFNIYSEEFRVAIRELEGDIKPQNFQYLGVAFVLRQLHEPLFIKSNSGITSHILSNWTADEKYKNYKLCVKEKTFFSNGKVFTSAVLLHNLKRLEKLGFIRHKIVSNRIKGKCLMVAFSNSYYGFLDETQSLRTSILDPSSVGEKIPIGISSYYVSSYVPGKKLILKTALHANKKPDFDIIAIDILGTQKISLLQLKY